VCPTYVPLKEKHGDKTYSFDGEGVRKDCASVAKKKRKRCSFKGGDVSIKLSMEEFALPTAQCVNVAALRGDAPIKLLREEFVTCCSPRFRCDS
jgi:hypothetical protein